VNSPHLAQPSGVQADDTTADYGVLRWLVLATFIVILNETVMINAIPRLMAEFDVTARAAQWLSTAFMLTLAVVIPITGWFLQRVTTRAAFTTAMVTFCVGTLAAALAPTFGILLAARIVQASGTAVMMPLLMTTLMTVVAERDRGRIMGNVTLAISVAPALGPAVSGVVLHIASWRWMFGLVLPVAIAITAVSLRNLRNVGEPVAGSVDWLSVAMSALGFGPLVYGLSEVGGEVDGRIVFGSIAVGLVVVGTFIGRQIVLQRTDRPLLDLRTLTVPTYAKGLALMSAAFMAFLASMILLPLYLQQARDLSALQTGLMMAPGGLAMGLLGPQVGKAFDRVGARPVIIPGAASVTVGLAALSRVDLTTPLWFVLAAHIALMIGLAAVFTPVFALTLGALPQRLYSHGSSTLGALQQIAGAIGTAVSITVLSWRSGALTEAGRAADVAMAGGMRWAFTIGAVISLVVLALAMTMPGRVSEDLGDFSDLDVDDQGGQSPEPTVEPALG
jgi:DHA2 family lincomycin resistance protein-like MFS transporter